MFAKMFESAEHGQLVVMKDQNGEGDPCVKFYFDPRIDGLSVCSSVLSVETEEARDLIFIMVELEDVESAVGKVIEFLKNAESETL